MRILMLALILGGTSHAAIAAEAPSAATKSANAALAATLNFDDKQDFDFATRGLIAKPTESAIRDKKGAIVRNFADDAQFKGPAPASVNPSLWRNSLLVANAGLFKVCLLYTSRCV